MDLMKIICKDAITFQHFQDLAIQKYRFNEELQTKISHMKRNKSIQIPEKGEELHLFEILMIQSKIYGKENTDIKEYYEKIHE